VEAESQIVRLRAAAHDDALRLGVLATQVFLDTYAFAGITEAVANEVRTSFCTASFASLLQTPAVFITVAEVGFALVGFAQTRLAVHQPLAPDGSHAELERLYVQEPFTGRGIGRQLLRNHEVLATKQGANLLWLSPWVGNHRALGFYAKQGYQDFGLTYFHMGSAKIENRVYAKQVSAVAA